MNSQLRKSLKSFLCISCFFTFVATSGGANRSGQASVSSSAATTTAQEPITITKGPTGNNNAVITGSGGNALNQTYDVATNTYTYTDSDGNVVATKTYESDAYSYTLTTADGKTLTYDNTDKSYTTSNGGEINYDSATSSYSITNPNTGTTEVVTVSGTPTDDGGYVYTYTDSEGNVLATKTYTYSAFDPMNPMGGDESVSVQGVNGGSVDYTSSPDDGNETWVITPPPEDSQ